jgi:hypothetical protein
LILEIFETGFHERDQSHQELLFWINNNFKTTFNPSLFQQQIKYFKKKVKKENFFSSFEYCQSFFKFLRDNDKHFVESPLTQIDSSLIDFTSKSINYFELEYPSSAFHLIIPLYSISKSKSIPIYLTSSIIPLQTILVGGYEQTETDFILNFCRMIKTHQEPLFLLFPELLNKEY